ncbi:MAG: anaerobic glycerol-3-phosphate dehydrogenase subunit A [Desulfatibacillaceae bacterium]
MKRIETQVVIIGGGATGAGTLRDCAIRGIPAALVEKGDLTSGTSGRNHGLLHSGARYAVKDTRSARECIVENAVLKRIAQHCVEDTGGLFVTLDEDDYSYHEQLISACELAGISCEDIGIRQALRIEPNVSSGIKAAIRVPDATVDPFRLVAANVLDATERGSRVYTHTEVTGLILDGDRVAGVRCRDKTAGMDFEIRARIVVNASGVYGQQVCNMAGVELAMFPSKGSMIIIDYRINNTVVNRARPAADGDIVVPGDTVSLIGTTSKKIPYSEIENLHVDDDEIEVLLADGEKLIPNVSRTRVLRAYCGVRPLIAESTAREGREISRGIVLIDHRERDGLRGFVTIAGGKLTTCRLMAEMTTDLLCKKFGADVPCTTHELPLPGSETPVPKKRRIKSFTGVPTSVVGSTHFRHGERIHSILSGDRRNYGLICECEMVTSGEVEYALRNLHVHDLIDLRRRTRLGMGPCQGALCSYRAAGLTRDLGLTDAAGANAMLVEFIEERWKGVKPVLWGDALREMEFAYWIYQGLFGLAGVQADEDTPHAPEVAGESGESGESGEGGA